MRSSFALLALLLMSGARADILPTPDRGPPTASVMGLDFEVRQVSVKFPTGYYKTLQVAVLAGCTEGRPNCRLAKARGVIGMEVLSVNGETVEDTGRGRLQGIIDAFTAPSPDHTVVLELYARDKGGSPLKVTFVRP